MARDPFFGAFDELDRLNRKSMFDPVNEWRRRDFLFDNVYIPPPEEYESRKKVSKELSHLLDDYSRGRYSPKTAESMMYSIIKPHNEKFHNNPCAYYWVDDEVKARIEKMKDDVYKRNKS
jgi:hypothetical protein